jgi:hypothetical protein
MKEAIEEEFIARQQQQQSSAQKQGVWRVDFNTTVPVQQEARVIRQQQPDGEWVSYLRQAYQRHSRIDRIAPTTCGYR